MKFDHFDHFLIFSNEVGAPQRPPLIIIMILNMIIIKIIMKIKVMIIIMIIFMNSDYLSRVL